mmetsp:Transcript_53406/g.153188  ORF Transcript_53406/g.153188 Transcript_53406/m.153188 type:complete len:420 (+) Transcript_53406:90-1349(+)
MAEKLGVQIKELIQRHFHRLVSEGRSPNEAAVEALELAKAEAVASGAAPAAPAAAAIPAVGASGAPPPASSAEEAAAGQAASRAARHGASKYGPLCLGLAGPFQSICIVGEPRLGKKLLVLDIDHTIYDPSNHDGVKGSVVSSNANGLFDESVVARCRPGLHEFLTEAYKAYDIMVWSASDMLRILMLLQQLGIVGGGHSDYRVVAVLDVDSMSELRPAAGAETQIVSISGSEGALVQAVVVPVGALPGQQIEVRSITTGAPMVVMVPPGKKPGDEFLVTIPGAVSSVSEELGLDAADVQLALQMSMGHVTSDAPVGEGTSVAPLPKARRKGSRVKPLSLIWACSEFSHLYCEKNTVIVDDTVDVCSANPHNSIQCIRYFLKDHATDAELPRLTKYLLRIADAPELPPSHVEWRDGLPT